jgi:hypothetical protein
MLVVGHFLLPMPQTAASHDPMYKLQQVTLKSGQSVVKRWNPCQAAITYQVNLAGLPEPERPAMLAQVIGGFGQLSAATGLPFRYTGSTAFVPNNHDSVEGTAEIVVAVVPRSATDFDLSSALGVGGMQVRTWSGNDGEGAVAIRGFVVLDAARTASLKPGFGKGQTQGNLLLHELGHATGLDHVASEAEQMNPKLSPALPKGYGRGDLIGLEKLGKKAGCIAVPPVVSIVDLT